MSKAMLMRQLREVAAEAVLWLEKHTGIKRKLPRKGDIAGCSELIRLATGVSRRLELHHRGVAQAYISKRNRVWMNKGNHKYISPLTPA